MIYDYQYDIAAIVATLVLLGVYLLKRSYVTRSNLIFLGIVVLDLLTAITDLASIYGISNPESIPVALNYFFSQSYLFLYNMLSVCFLCYIDSRAKIPSWRIPLRLFMILVESYYLITIGLTPITHLVIYFDENGGYHHGPLMVTLYILPFIMFLLDFAMFYFGRMRFTFYQIISSTLLILGMSLSVAITYLLPKALIGPMVVALVLFFVYSSYENPAYYTYRESPLPNRRAFHAELKRRIEKEIPTAVLGFRITDYEYWEQLNGRSIMEELSGRVAEMLFRNFGMKAFCISDDMFVILDKSEDSFPFLSDKILAFFRDPIHLRKTDMRVLIAPVAITDLNFEMNVDEMEELITYRLQNPDYDVDSDTLIKTSIDKKKSRQKILYLIKSALENDNFAVYYQPIFNLEKGSFESAEALIRLYDDSIGFINPEELISIAEQNNLIEAVGDLVFRKVCSFIASGEPNAQGIKFIEVNLSPLQCINRDMADNYRLIMAEYGIAPSSINFEVTESEQMNSDKNVTNNILQLHALGSEFSIDDYGSGFASADYLIRLPVEIVKIDKSILWHAMKNEQAMVVLRGTIAMIKELGKKIVVEGVEDEEMIRVLREMGCDYLQGFYYSKPLPMDEFIEYLKRKK